ncbi:LysR family transcriptional regulator [Glaesserella sp.]|uniref:LysR family transcriptional regulator n=1 Tax=Glaesserella sp. TaxID=2094731 RepID=UPI00359F689F
MDKIQSLKIFVGVVETGSFSQCAELMNVHVSVVSKAIKFLETQLGSRLINRTTRSLAVTAEGERLYEKSVSLLADLEDTFQDLSGSAQLPQGKLRVDMPSALAPFILANLADFKQRYADIQLVLTSSDELGHLIDEGLDCTIRMGDLVDSGYIAKRLGNVPMVLCASPDYLAKWGEPQDLTALPQHQAVNYFSGKQRKIMTWQFLQNGQPHSLKMPSAMLVNDSHALLYSVLAGIGIGYMPKILAKDYFHTQQLVPLLTQFELPSRAVWLVYPQRTFIPKRLQVFIDWVGALFADWQ